MAAAALLLTGPAAASPAQEARRPHEPAPLPACTAPEDHTFPLTTRVHGGPGAYAAGGGHGTWYLDLTNTTDRTCSGIHPVVVLVDQARALEPAQPRLEFRDGDGRRHPVRFEETDADELIGVLADDGNGDDGDEDHGGFPGFTVPAGQTVSVELRLAFTADTGSGDVTAAAAVVQRREGDGEWIGQSQDYRFGITADGPSARTTAAASLSPAPSASPSVPGSDRELAGTGQRRTYAVLALAALLVAAGSTAVALTRRRG
ncbi:hypothetical protein [Streptomyces sp. CRN 30]|uniref:hypothetical protein n=1 Tax=Streptomyces sp. CRN 30 TaxID=3075613 RepID=UPI002A8162CC|nr:hypothetical protein [Streptomyces sp. CRN 30]